MLVESADVLVVLGSQNSSNSRRLMEIGAGQEDELLRQLKGIGLSDCKCVEDFAGIGRYLLAWKKK